MFCTTCGDWNPDTAQFCTQCGGRLGGKLPADAGQFVGSFMDRLQKMASTGKLEGFSLSAMFSEVFRKRSTEEIEEYFLTGTTKATPPIDQVQTGWPKPWFFFRVLVFVAVLSAGFYYASTLFQNRKMIPGLIMMGTLTMPMATLVLFFELNSPRNVPLYRLIMLFLYGGVVSLLVSLAGFEMANLNWLGASSAGIVEEIGKLLTVVVLCRQAKYKYILNGLLFGAAVGAGFSAFESAGYAFSRLLDTNSMEAMVSIMTTRAFLAPFGHVPGTAIAAGALWRTKGNRPLSLKMLGDPQFLKAFSIPVILHMIWNAPIPMPFHIVQLSMGIIGWIVVFGLVQQGLQEVREEQQQTARKILLQKTQSGGSR